MDNKIAVIDIETTGFLNDGGTIVEVAIIELDLDTCETKILLDYVVHETNITLDKLKDSWIIKNSDLTIEQVRYSINLKHIINSISKIVEQYSVTAFNRQFDVGFLKDRGVIFKYLYPCPMLELTPIMKLHFNNNRSIGNAYKWPNVEEAYKFFFPNEEYKEKHRACDDALHEAKIIYQLHKLKLNETIS